MRYKIMAYWPRPQEWVEVNDANLIHKAIHRYASWIDEYPDITTQLIDTGELGSNYDIMKNHEARYEEDEDGESSSDAA